jgi:hypothetical protein
LQAKSFKVFFLSFPNSKGQGRFSIFQPWNSKFLCPWKSNQQLVAIHRLQILKAIKSWGITYLNLIRKGGKLVYYIPLVQKQHRKKIQKEPRSEDILSSLFSHWSTVNFQTKGIRWYFRRHAKTPPNPNVYIWRFQIFGPHNLVTFGPFFRPPKKMGLRTSSTGYIFFLSFLRRRQDPKFRPRRKRWQEGARLDQCPSL